MIKLLQPLLTALFLLTTVVPVYAQSDSIDSFIQMRMAARKIPGLQLAIIKDSRIIKTGNYGYANLQDSIPVKSNTLFFINSITKAFTGVSIVLLAEQGKLRLSDKVSMYLNDLPIEWKDVTIQQLLSHTSGIPDIIDEEESTLISADGEAASWKIVKNMPMNFKPGEKFSYNQTNYLLLGRLIDTLSGKSFQQHIIDAQLTKAAMHNTIRAGFNGDRYVITGSANAYRYAKGQYIKMFHTFPSSLQTAAGMSATATELAQWIIALQGLQIIRQQHMLDLLWRPDLLLNGRPGGFNGLLNGYAAGWPVAVRPEHPASAAIGGGRSAVFVYPNDKLSIVVLTNLSGASPEGFIDELAGMFIPDMKEANGFGLSSDVKMLRTIAERTDYADLQKRYKTLLKKNTSIILQERDVNTWGYRLMRQQRLAHALEVFKLNVQLYPESANAYDSLGEIYDAVGNNTESLKNYERSLQLDPENAGAAAQIKRLKGIQ